MSGMIKIKIERLRYKGRGWMEKYICWVGYYKGIIPEYFNKNVYLKVLARVVCKVIPNYIIQASSLWIGYKYEIYMNDLIYIISCCIFIVCVLKICQKKCRPNFNFFEEHSKKINNLWWIGWFSKHKNWNTICYVIYNYIHIWTIWHGIKLICIYIMRKINSVIQYLKRKSKRIFLFRLLCKIEKIWILVIKGMYWIGEDIIEFTIKYVLMIYYKIKVKIYSENIWKLLRWRIMVGIYGMVFLKYTLGIISIIYIYKLLENIIKKWVNNYENFIKSMLYKFNDYSLLYHHYVPALVIWYRKASSLFMYNAMPKKKIVVKNHCELDRLPMKSDGYRNICLFYIDVVDIYKQHKEEMYRDSSGKTILPILYKIKLEEIINKSINMLMVEWQYKDKMLQKANDSEKKEVIESYFVTNEVIYYKWIDIIEMIVENENNELLYLSVTFSKANGFVVHIVIDKGEYFEKSVDSLLKANVISKDEYLENTQWEDSGGNGWRSCEKMLNWLFMVYNEQLVLETKLEYDRYKPNRRIWSHKNFSDEVLTEFVDKYISTLRDRVPVPVYAVDIR